MISNKLIQQTRELQRRFSLINSRTWTIETYMIELLGETGSLADSIMLKENYRPIRAGQKPVNLADDIVDIIFILVNIADHYGIDLEESYKEMLRVTDEKLSQREKAKDRV
jgi:NTP pyrophosphatase (non-canonical NTP hydrolase)